VETGLAGKSVIITGGNGNIGRGIALEFAKEGSRLVIAARDHEAGGRVERAALDLGAESVLWVQTDVLDPEQIQHMVQRTVDEFGHVDVLVNNVGGHVDAKPFWETTREQCRREIDLTLTSTLDCTRAVLPGMIARRYGRIVNIGSTSGLIGDMWLSPYSAAKAAVHGFTKVLAKEVGRYGITVNAVAPRGTRAENPEEELSAGSRWQEATGLREARDAAFLAVGVVPDSQRTKTVVAEALGRDRLRPAEVGSAAVFLAADSSCFVTGQILVVDGGMLLVP
jgi:2-hydroxycyclohexanecarboxyl-CoA dehydrogenase